MKLRDLAQRPSLFLVGLLLAGALSACAPATTSTGAQSVATTPPAAATVAPAATAAPAATSGAETAAATMTKFNLNTVTSAQILTIPNAGNRMVREFQEYRPYTSITQFRQEIGKYVDAATVAGYEQYVYVPVDPNAADAATLQQIPGVTADLSQALIAARPYASADAFLAKLAESLSAEQVAVAKAYLQ